MDTNTQHTWWSLEYKAGRNQITDIMTFTATRRCSLLVFAKFANDAITTNNVLEEIIEIIICVASSIEVRIEIRRLEYRVNNRGLYTSSARYVIHFGLAQQVFNLSSIAKVGSNF